MFVYILFSESIGQYYVGITANITDRLERHNQGRSKATKRGIPWELKRIIPVCDRKEAVRLEKQIKGRGIRPSPLISFWLASGFGNEKTSLALASVGLEVVYTPDPGSSISGRSSCHPDKSSTLSVEIFTQNCVNSRTFPLLFYPTITPVLIGLTNCSRWVNSFRRGAI